MSFVVLGIESSCDETAASIVTCGRIVLSNVINSQISIHTKFGGVVPEVASRNHIEAIDTVVKEALEQAKMKLSDVNAIAVTYGAGLVGALLVGVSYAKALSQASGIPLYAVNHIEGHICANYLSHNELTPPYVCLIASGGHTSIVNVIDYTKYEVLFSTVDDAIGEAFDKVARVLSQPYPGGVYIDKLTKEGKANIKLPSALLANGNFSYSGLKTAVVNYVHNAHSRNETVNVNDVAASFSAAAINGLVDQCLKCVKQLNYDKIAVAGGVGANSYLRARLIEKAGEISVLLPDKLLCTDNAAMIASQGYFLFKSGAVVADNLLNAVPTLKLRADNGLKKQQKVETDS